MGLLSEQNSRPSSAARGTKLEQRFYAGVMQFKVCVCARAHFTKPAVVLAPERAKLAIGAGMAMTSRTKPFILKFFEYQLNVK